MKVLKFGAVWCSGCLVMRPRWQKVEDDNPWLKTDYYDFDQDKKMVNKYQVDKGKLPCFVFLNQKGKEVARKTGEMSEKQILELVEKYKDN